MADASANEGRLAVSIRNFPPEILTLVTRLEIGLLYVDVVVSGVILLLCLVRLVRDVLEGL